MIALRIARVELRRTLRTAVSSQTRILLYGVLGLLLFGPTLLFGSLLASTAGEQLAAGEIESDTLEFIPTAFTGSIAVGLLGLTTMATIRTFTSVGDVEQPAHLLIATSLQNVVVGLMLREAAVFLLWLGVPVLVVSGAFAEGAMAPLVPVLAVLTLGVVLLVAIPVGFVIGLSARHLLTVYEPIARYRTPVILALAALYFGGIALGWLERVLVFLFELLGDSPLGWPGQVVLLGVPEVEATAWHAAGAVIAGAGVGLLAVGLAVRVAEYHWFADPARTGDEEAESVDSSDRLGALLSGLVSRPTRTVTVTAIRRTRRAPIRLAYVAYPLFGTFFFIEEMVQTGRLPAYAAVLLALYVVWSSGALFTLNVLGDQGPAMAAVLTSTISGRAVVSGTALAGVLVALPLALVVAPVAGAVSPLTAVETALLTGGALVGVVVSPLVAAGVGSWFPRFGSVRVTNNREAVMPSKTAFLVYSLALGFPLGAAGVLRFDAEEPIASLPSFLLSLLPVVDITVPEVIITVGAVTVVAAGVVAPFASVQYAIRRFEAYRPY